MRYSTFQCYVFPNVCVLNLLLKTFNLTKHLEKCPTRCNSSFCAKHILSETFLFDMSGNIVDQKRYFKMSITYGTTIGYFSFEVILLTEVTRHFSHNPRRKFFACNC